MISPQNRNVFILGLTCILLIVSACSLPQLGNSNEDITTNQPPAVEPGDTSPFQDIGCTWQTENYAVCEEGSVPKKMGCDTLSTTPDFLNLLDENSQFVICSYAPHLQEKTDEEQVKGLFESGCAIPFYERLLTYREGDYLLISDLEDLKYYYSPINSETKALGYAIAATGFTPRYSFDEIENYRFLVDDLAATQVLSSEGSYEINLFDYQLCGCGPHTYFMNSVKISHNGDIEIMKSTPVFENPAEDDLCVD